MGFWHRLATPTGFPEAELQSLPDIYPKLGLVIYLYHINRVLCYTLLYLNILGQIVNFRCKSII